MVRHLVRPLCLFMCRGSQSVQSFQAGSKFRLFLFQAVVLAFFAIIVSAQAPAQTGKLATTTTSLAVSTQDNGTRTHATFEISVGSQGDVPTGTVSLMEGDLSLGSAVLDADGHATISVDALPSGTQKVVAVYNGDGAHASSTSLVNPVASATSGIADYTLTAASTSLSVSAGGAATTTITVTPENGFNQYVSFSCSGLPAISSCFFTPATVSTASGSAAPTTLTIQTTGVSGATAQLKPQQPSALFYALTVPGVLALVGLGGLRKRWHFSSRLLGTALLLFVGLGLTACSARYSYLHHGPGLNTGTPAGAYTVTITSSSDNGITETAHSLTLTLTVK